MTDLLFSNQYFCVALTVIVFSFAQAIQNKWKHAIFNTILIGAGIMICILVALDVPNSVYQEGCRFLNYLLTPATICLAISFYEQYKALRQHMGALVLGVIVGTIACLGSIFLLCRFFGFDRILTLSLLPKGITNAIGVALSEEIGGIAALTSAGIAVTGTFCSICGAAMCKWFHIEDPIARGAAFGTASHVIGTARAAEMSALSGAVGSLSLTIAGLFTALVLSFAAQYI